MNRDELRTGGTLVASGLALGWAINGWWGAVVATTATALLMLILARNRPEYGPHQ